MFLIAKLYQVFIHLYKNHIFHFIPQKIKRKTPNCIYSIKHKVTNNSLTKNHNRPQKRKAVLSSIELSSLDQLPSERHDIVQQIFHVLQRVELGLQRLGREIGRAEEPLQIVDFLRVVLPLKLFDVKAVLALKAREVVDQRGFAADEVADAHQSVDEDDELGLHLDRVEVGPEHLDTVVGDEDAGFVDEVLDFSNFFDLWLQHFMDVFVILLGLAIVFYFDQILFIFRFCFFNI